MRCQTVRTLLGAVCLVLPAILAAETLPVETFTRHATVTMPRLSPDGQHIAANLHATDGDSHAIVIYRVDDLQHPLSMLRLPKFELAAGIHWVSNTRLVVEKGRQFGSIDIPQATGEILATDIDGKHQDYLYGHESRTGSRGATRGTDRGWGSVDGIPSPVNGHFYMTTQSWDNERYSVLQDVDASRNTRREIARITPSGLDFMVGTDGKVHFAYGRDENWEYVVHRFADGNWLRMSAGQSGVQFTPLQSTPDRQGIYAIQAQDEGPTSLVQQSMDGSQRQVLAAADFGNVGSVEWTAPPLRPFATTLATGRPSFSYIDANLPEAKLHRAISQKFPGHVVHFIDFSEDGSQLLFSAASDRDPGTYYLIDTHNYQVVKLFSAAPWIDPQTMAERRSVRFVASDGLELEAILTVPNGVGAENLPMVLLPHGGPIGVSDDWYFDTDAQFLANRGYLVLQVNYRGSGGRGAGFMEAGYLKWGTRIQQDLIDGVKWAIAGKLADPQRICVYGASFGGYSALMTTIRAPGLFKCAVGYAGIYDLAMMYKKGDIRESKAGRSYLTTVIGRTDAELASNSPTHLASQVDVPVLLVHGEDDHRAPFAQAKAMRAALDAAHKPYEWLSKPGEGHGFYAEKNNVEFYNRLEAFLSSHIGKGSAAGK